MGLSDKKQTSTSSGSTTNQYGFLTPNDTPDIIRARNDSARIDPSIGYRTGEGQRQLNESLASPMGGYTTPQIRDAIRRSGQRELMQMGGEQAREGQSDVNRLNQSRNLALAGLTQGRLVNTGSTSSGTGTVTQGTNPFGTALQVGASVAPMSL